ncbi:MAG TPA: NUDIX hydrolase [Terriglobales bacterium]|nr:NUDIX hydrolase [Terriglobales bacterium]
MPKRTPAKRIKLLSSKEVYSGPVFSVFTDFVQEGEYRGRRDVIRHPGSIVVFAIDDEKSADPNILLEYQYRHVVGDHIWELPAGRIDPGETKLAAAKRELLEETGYRAKRWKRAFQFYASPGFLDETMDIFIASGLTQGNARPEEDEQITTRFFPLSSAVKLVMNATIFDAKTMTAVLWYANQQSRKS